MTIAEACLLLFDVRLKVHDRGLACLKVDGLFGCSVSILGTERTQGKDAGQNKDREGVFHDRF